MAGSLMSKRNRPELRCQANSVRNSQTKHSSPPLFPPQPPFSPSNPVQRRPQSPSAKNKFPAVQESSFPETRGCHREAQRVEGQGAGPPYPCHAGRYHRFARPRPQVRRPVPHHRARWGHGKIPMGLETGVQPHPAATPIRLWWSQNTVRTQRPRLFLSSRWLADPKSRSLIFVQRADDGDAPMFHPIEETDVPPDGPQ